MKLALVPAVTVVAIAATTLTACGGSSPSAQASAPPSAAAPGLPTVQPCDALDAAAVSKALGSTVRVDKGTAASPVCFLRPDQPDGAAFDMNYQWFYVHGLEDYFRTAKLPAGKLSDIAIPGADAGKLIINAEKSAYHVTGYIQNGALVQSVNGVGASKDAKRILAATKVILAQLSAGAPSTPAELASPSPSAG